MWFFIIAFSLIVCYFIWRQAKKYQRQGLINKPLPAQWQQILNKNVLLYKKLPGDLKKALCGHIQVFLSEKKFYGCAGLEISDEIRVTIAAFACMLLLNRDTNYYPGFKSIFVYPSTYIATIKTWDGVVESVQQNVRLGESWQRGPIVLAWDSVRQGALDIKDGHNVVLHEFAHKLDEADGSMDGTPLLSQRSHYVSWARVMQKEYDKLQRRVNKGRQSVMDKYGATEPAEFFAVLTETFFEKPKQLQRKHPRLYEEVKQFFQVDPASW